MLDKIYSASHIVIDVRTPSEFSKGHIPGAQNIPLFTDEERAAVGTTYVQQGSDLAIQLGKELVQPRIRSYVESAHRILNEHATATNLVLYCWRGGMRSAALADLYRNEGLSVSTIPRGYKAYRQKVLEDLEKPWQLIVIGGRTGAGKTHVIETLRKKGMQVVNIESIANHRGSAFGAIGMPPQPSSEHAMNLLHNQLDMLHPSEVIFVEDESQTIGTVALHNGFYNQLLNSSRIVMDVPKNIRVRQLMKEYGQADLTELLECFQRISKKLGGARHALAKDALQKGNLDSAVNIALEYYDKAYDFWLNKNAATIMARVSSNDGNPDFIADRIARIVNATTIHGH